MNAGFRVSHCRTSCRSAVAEEGAVHPLRDEMIGTTVSHYRVMARLGAGGMGVVYEAEDMRLRRRVALKFLPDEMADRSALQRFRREAEAASALNHPHICTIYDIGEHEGRPFIVMERLEGESLRERIGGKPLPVDTVLKLGSEIAEALASAHAAGIIHRDIKPANLFVTARGDAKLLDFGLARIDAPQPASANSGSATAEMPEEITKGGSTLGTIAYMSPEQARGEPLDGRSDLFSLGAVLYEMATGIAPFRGATPAAIFDAILNRDPEPSSRLNPGIPLAFEQVILAALEKDRELRIQSAGELRAQLLRLRRDSSASMRTASGAAGDRRSMEERPNRRFILVGLLTGAALIAAVAGSIAVQRAERTAERSLPGSAQQTESIALAVLPLASIGGGEESEFFADGVTEEIITALTKVEGIRVISRTSSFAFKGASVDAQEIGRKLNVRQLVEGSVRRAGDRVRIAVRLTNAEDGSQLWGESYERDLRDIFALQDEIAASVVHALDARLDVGRRSTVKVDPEIYTAYLRGKHLLNLGGYRNFEQAVEVLERVTRDARGFAPAYATLADAYLWLEHGGGPDANRLYERGLAAARKAIELDPQLGDAHAALAHGLAHEGKLQEALASADRAVTLSPGSAVAARWRSLILGLMRLPGGRVEAERALSLDPLSLDVVVSYAEALIAEGDYAQSAAILEKATAFEGNDGHVERTLTDVYALMGARQEWEHAWSRTEQKRGFRPDRHLMEQIRRSDHLALLGDRLEARRILESLEYGVLSGGGYSTLARAWAAAGDTDRAIAVLEEAFERNPHYMTVNSSFHAHPAYAAVRADPRYQALRRRHGLPPG
jgi:eukaryotic-like serine/threonine-protein kinase